MFLNNCVNFDLRVRYKNPIPNFTSFIQDFGRSFGYGERPTVQMSVNADKFLNEIWDEETDSISTLKNPQQILLIQMKT
jgi:hypothetical protein